MSLFTWLIAADAIHTLGKALDEEMNEQYKIKN